MGYNSCVMARLYEITCALCHYLRLHFSNPKLSKCMLVSMLLVIATLGPIARAQQSLAKSHSMRSDISIVFLSLMGRR